jgi:coenzyme F420-0:L-glutamate ligase / coenzyme F420-1:gamma-L-glutamate ligase
MAPGIEKPIDDLGVATLQAWGLHGIGEVRAGDDLARHVLDGMTATDVALEDGDVLIVSSKVVSKALGLAAEATSRDEVVAAQTVRVVAERMTPRGAARIVRSASGPVLAAAGVDESNVALGTVLVLPPDPDAAARSLRHALAERTRRRIGVVITDTMGRPWRDGQVDAAVGVAGLLVVDDLRGRSDAYGNPLEVTVRALVDEVASLGDLVKGKLAARPAALVRGLAELVTDEDGPGAAALLRESDADWFRLGHLEAVRTAVGVPPGTSGVGPAPAPPGSAAERLGRAVEVAYASPQWRSTDWPSPARPVLVADGVEVPVPSDADPAALLALGALAQRIVALAIAEGVQLEVAPWTSGTPLRLRTP